MQHALTNKTYPLNRYIYIKNIAINTYIHISVPFALTSTVNADFRVVFTYLSKVTNI